LSAGAAERLAKALEATSDFVAMVTPTGDVLYLSDPGHRLVGLDSTDGSTNVALTRFVPAEELDRLFADAWPAAREIGVWRGDTVFVGSDGREIPVSLTVQPLRAADGTFESFALIARDVSGERRAIEALRCSEERFRKLIEELHVGVVVQGPRSEILVANREAIELLGLSEQELRRRSSYDPEWQIVFEDGSPAPPELRPVARVLATRRAVHGVVLGIQRDESEERTWVLVNAEPEIVDGELVHVVATLQDISERKRLERSLLHAQKLESVGRLAGGMAHDFNNLLTVISNCATIAARNVTPTSRAGEALAEVLDAARRGAELTRRLLAFARRQVVDPRLVDVSQELESMRPLLARLLGDDIGLTVDVRGEPGPVRIDPSQLEQVVVNLAANGRDAMPDGGQLHIEIVDGRRDAPAGDWVELRVRDTGSGMSENVRAHAFEPFYTTKTLSGGTGLGLATVHGIVTQAGGDVWLSSSPAQGTTVVARLPLADAPPAEPTPVPALATAPAHETVLLAEDEPVLRNLVAEVLSESGYRVLLASDGDQALVVARGHGGPIHLLLTDVLMPGIRGPQLAATLQRERPELKVLFVSGYAEDVTGPGGLPPGTGFLPKPYTPSALTGKVRAVLDGR
jgi:PAS domain S-box-containing protein